MFVYELRHDRPIGRWRERTVDFKLIGYFTDPAEAWKAAEQLDPLEGFRDFPSDFTLRRIQVDQDLGGNFAGD